MLPRALLLNGAVRASARLKVAVRLLHGAHGTFPVLGRLTLPLALRRVLSARLLRWMPLALRHLTLRRLMMLSLPARILQRPDLTGLIAPLLLHLPMLGTLSMRRLLLGTEMLLGLGGMGTLPVRRLLRGIGTAAAGSDTLGRCRTRRAPGVLRMPCLVSHALEDTTYHLRTHARGVKSAQLRACIHVHNSI